MTATREESVVGISELIGATLSEMDGRHRATLASHDRKRNELNERIQTGDKEELVAAWRRYHAVVNELDAVTAEIESLRLSVR